MISIHISCTQAITWTIYFLISSVFSRHQGFQVQKKLCIIFFISESGDGKRRVKKNPWSVQISVSDPHSQPRHYFQEALSSSASWAVIVWYSIMQQVCFLFHSFPSLAMSFTCTDSVTGDSHLIVIRQSAVYEGQYFEGGHETNKPIRGERWDQSVIDWLRGRREGGQRRGGKRAPNRICIPNEESGMKGLSCYGNTPAVVWLHWYEGPQGFRPWGFESSRSFVCVRPDHILAHVCKQPATYTDFNSTCDNTASVSLQPLCWSIWFCFQSSSLFLKFMSPFYLTVMAFIISNAAII